MDRVRRLEQETADKIARLHLKHQKEWDDISKESEIALSKASTVKEIKRINKEYKERMELLRVRQKDELLELQKDFTRNLLQF